MSYPIIEAVSTKELTALASSITINKPTGTAAGDLLIAFASGYNRNTNALNANPSPSGWTDLYYNRQAAFWARSESIISYKVAGASEGTDYTFNFSGDMVPAGKIFRVSNFDIDSIVVASSHHMEDNWDTDPIIATAITATADNLLFFMGCGGRDNASFTPQIGVPSGMDDQGQLRSTKIDSYEDIYHAQRIATEEVGAGATGTRTATNANAQMWHAHLIAINGAEPPPDSGSLSRTITVKKEEVPSIQYDVPVKVYLTGVNFDFSKPVDGTDIYFKSGITELSFERVYYDDVADKALFWVKVPEVSNVVDKVFTMHYGDSGTEDKQNAADVWSNGYVGVWHFYDDSSNIVKDSKGNHNSDIFAGTWVNDFYGCGLEFDGAEAAVRIPRHLDLIPANLTVTAYWYAKADGQSGSSAIVSFPRGTTGVQLYDLRLRPDNMIRSAAYASNDTNYDISGTTVAAKNTWNRSDHVINAADDYRGTIYLNGTQEANSTNLTAALSTGFVFDLYFGGTLPDAIVNRRFQGILGAISISNVARSQAWRELEDTIMDDDLITIGSEAEVINTVDVGLLEEEAVLQAEIDMDDVLITDLVWNTMLLDGYVMHAVDPDLKTVDVGLLEEEAIMQAEIDTVTTPVIDVGLVEEEAVIQVVAEIETDDLYKRKHYGMHEDRDRGVVYRTELLQKDGTGIASEVILRGDPLYERSIKLSKDKRDIIFGSERRYSFVVKKDDINDFDPMFESDYKDWMLRVYECDPAVDTSVGGTLTWAGYVQVDNMYRTISGPNVEINLSATDALKDLSITDFNDSGIPYTGKQTVMEVIKNAIAPIGIELNFLVKLNIHETTQSATELCFLNTYVDTFRFSKVVSGKTSYDSCLDVLEKVLKPFNVAIRQVDGQYRIYSFSEQNTFNYLISWTGLYEISRTAADDIVDVTDWNFTPNAELSLIAPVKFFEVTHLNRNLGSSLVPNLDNWTAGGVWDIDYVPTDRTTETLRVTLNHIYPGTDKIITLVNDFTVTKLTDRDYLKVRLSNRFTDSVNLNGYPRFRLSIKKPDGIWHHHWDEVIHPDWQVFESPNSETFRITETGDYNIRIQLYIDQLYIDNSDNWGINTYFRDVDITKIVSVGGDEFAEDVTFDSFFRLTSDEAGKRRIEQETVFGDSEQFGDLGSFYIGDTNTKLWTRAGLADNKPIIELWGLLNLTDRQRYKEALSIDFVDKDNVLRPDTIIKATRDGDTRYYNFQSFERSTKKSIVKGRLEERLYTDVGYQIYYTPLTSIDGQDRTSGTSVVYGSGGDVSSTERTNWNAAYNYSLISHITGSLTTGYVPVASAAKTLIDSPIRKDGDVIWIAGSLRVTGGITAYADDPTAVSIWAALPDEVRARVVLNDISNVSAASPSVDDVLTWNGTAWVPAPVGVGGVISETDPVFTAWRDGRTGFSIPGRAGVGTGALADIVADVNGVLRRSGSGNLAFGTLVTGNIGDSQVTLAKLQNLAADRIMGRISTSGAPQQLTADDVRSITGTLAGGTADGQVRTNLQNDHRFGRLTSTNIWTDRNTFTGGYQSHIRLDRHSGAHLWDITQSVGAGAEVGQSIRFIYNSSIKFIIYDTGAKVNGDLEATGGIRAYSV